MTVGVTAALDTDAICSALKLVSMVDFGLMAVGCALGLASVDRTSTVVGLTLILLVCIVVVSVLMVW